MKICFKKSSVDLTNPIVAPSWIMPIAISLKMFGDRKSGLICCQQERNLSFILLLLASSTEYSSSISFIWKWRSFRIGFGIKNERMNDHVNVMQGASMSGNITSVIGLYWSAICNFSWRTLKYRTLLTGYVSGSLPVFTEYIFLKTSRASSLLPFSKRKRGLSGNAKIAKQARNSGNEQIAKNTRHELIFTTPVQMLMVHFCGMINQAMPETKYFPCFMRTNVK